jgi:hypothetical protein
MAAKLNFIHLCDSAFMSAENGNLNVIGIFDTIVSANFPAVHPKFALVVNVGADEGLHTISVIFKKDSTEILKLERTFSGKAHQWINNFVGFKFQDAGEYEIQVLLDKELIGVQKLFLKKISN